jgi:glycosyltransferase involved in cell wall biosynthesis
MKILQLLCFPLYGSGSGTYVRKLSENLAKVGHKVAIVTPDNRELKKIKIYEVKLPFMAAFTGHPEYPDAKLYSQLSGASLNDIQSAFMEKIIEAVETFDPDVIHVHHAANLSWIANYIKAVYQIHYIVTSHNTDVLNAVLDKRYIPLTQDALNRADIITAVSKDTRVRLLNIIGRGYPKLPEKTKVLPCGVDTKLFPNKGSVRLANEKFNLGNKKVVLYSGKITPIKGVDLFVKTAKYFSETTFMVMGDGEEKVKMENLAKENGISNIIFTGYLGSDDRELIAQIYRRADVMLIPSTASEGIPLCALESLSSGTPVIASNIGGIPTAIKDKKTGLLIKPRSVSAIVSALRTFFGDEKLAQKLSENARIDAIERFDWSVIVKKLEKYYQISYLRSQKNRSTKKPSFITDEEYKKDKQKVKQIRMRFKGKL